MKQVNQKGLERIAAILKERHIYGDQFDADNVIAWAHDVEYQLDIGNPPAFEIPRHATLSGTVEEHELTEDCISNGGDQ